VDSACTQIQALQCLNGNWTLSGPWVKLDRKSLSALNENFKSFIVPLLNESNPEDYHLIWEFQKFFHSKRLQVLTAESEGTRKWKELLQSR
jgi:hypothetical protein